MAASNQTTIRRFLEKVVKGPIESDCWTWVGARVTSASGLIYGRSVLGHKQIHAHKKAYLIFVGPITPGQVVRHSCDNTLCINPAHLLIGTTQDNVQDRVNRDRSARGERQGSSKLTEKEVRFIRTSPLSCCQLAKDLHLRSSSTISAVRSRKTWKHVKEVE